MELTVRLSEQFTKYNCDPRLFFDLQNIPYRLIDTGPADILVTEYLNTNDVYAQKNDCEHIISIDLDLYHAYENGLQHIANRHCYHGNHYGVTLYQSDPLACVPPNLFLYKGCRNRNKAYFSQFQFSGDPWHSHYHAGQHGHIIRRLNSAEEKNRLCLAAVRTKTSKMENLANSRLVIANRARQTPDLVWLGNATDQHPGDWLHTMASYPEIESIFTLMSMPSKSQHFWPLHTAYYNDTFFSAYGETNEIGTSALATEKTYDPLMQGHFILPFSTVNFLDLIRADGFRLPDFIDYSYDTIVDYEHRLTAYATELDRLLRLPFATWQKLYNQHKESVLRYNQQQIHRLPYDTIDLVGLVARHRQ